MCTHSAERRRTPGPDGSWSLSCPTMSSYQPEDGNGKKTSQASKAGGAEVVRRPAEAISDAPKPKASQHKTSTGRSPRRFHIACQPQGLEVSAGGRWGEGGEEGVEKEAPSWYTHHLKCARVAAWDDPDLVAIRHLASGGSNASRNQTSLLGGSDAGSSRGRPTDLQDLSAQVDGELKPLEAR